MRAGADRGLRRDRNSLYATTLRGGWRQKDFDHTLGTGRRLRGGAALGAVTYPGPSVLSPARNTRETLLQDRLAGTAESKFRTRLVAARDADLLYSETPPAPPMGACTSAPSVGPPHDYRDRPGTFPSKHPTAPLTATLFKETHQPTPPEAVSPTGKLCCDKCDGAHATDNCPHYPKPRENHPDALRRKAPEMGRPCGDMVVRRAQVVRQPGDGSCLFHSLCHGLGSGSGSAASLRRELCSWIKLNPNVKIADTPLRDWLWWDSKRSPAAYAASMSISGWGGGIEMAACSRVRSVNIHVWEQNRLGPGYRRISCFDSPGHASKTINVLYQGGVHYDALVL